MEKLEVLTQPAPPELVESARRAARADHRRGPVLSRNARTCSIRSKSCAHSRPPPRSAARGSCGAKCVRCAPPAPACRSSPTATPSRRARPSCASGVWSAPLLAPFGLKAPLEAARGYHVQMPGATPLVDAPILYSDAKIVVTPMAGRVRATSFMEFAGVDAPPDPRKPAWLRATPARARLSLRRRGYRAGSALARCCRTIYPPWAGSPRRPTCCMRSGTSTSASRYAR